MAELEIRNRSGGMQQPQLDLRQVKRLQIRDSDDVHAGGIDGGAGAAAVPWRILAGENRGGERRGNQEA